MPRIAVSIYIDHQEVIQYPIGYVCRNLDWAEEIWLHCGDDTTYRLVSRTCGPVRAGIHAHNVNHKVKQPGDIATGRNKASKFLRENSACDWFVFLSADTLPTELASKEIIRICDKGVTEHPINIPTHMVTLFADAGWSNWGCTVASKNFIRDWDEDGSYFVNTFGGVGIDSVLCLHLGYLGTDMMGRHLMQHSKTWSSAEGEQKVDRYRNDRIGFIRQILSTMRDSGGDCAHHPYKNEYRLVMIDEPLFWDEERLVRADGYRDRPFPTEMKYLSEEYVKAIRGLGLSEDIELVRSVADEIGRARK